LVSVGGDAGSAAPIGCVVNTADAAIRLLELITQHGSQARASDLIRSHGLDVFRSAVAYLLTDIVERSRAVSSSLPPQGERKSRAAARQPIGAHSLRDGSVALGIGLAFGHIDANALEGVIAAARRLGAGELRATPGRALLVIGLTNKTSQALAHDAEHLGFITRPDDPRRSVVACAGAPICASAEIPARSLAPLLSVAGTQLVDGSLTIHLSGCAKGCAHPGPAALTLVGTKSGCDLVVDGSARDDADASVASDALPERLARVATEVARARQPAETCAAVLARLGAARVAQIFGSRHA
jgi:precorrin-3B synthase